MITHYDGTSGKEIVRLSAECVADCSRPGQPADDAVIYWRDKVEWLADDATLRESLHECGAWSDLNDVDTNTLRGRALWIAACDINENPADYVDE